MSEDVETINLNLNSTLKTKKGKKKDQARNGQEESTDVLKLNMNGTLKASRKNKDDQALDLTGTNFINVEKNDNLPPKERSSESGGGSGIYRKDFYNNDIKKKGKHKLTWIDKVQKDKHVASIVKVENYKNYFSNLNNTILGGPIAPVESKKNDSENEEKVKCKCIIF